MIQVLREDKLNSSKTPTALAVDAPVKPLGKIGAALARHLLKYSDTLKTQTSLPYNLEELSNKDMI